MIENNSSVEELLNSVQAAIDAEKNMRRKARNKRKALARKLRKQKKK